jgi:hypothetical protein
MKELSKVCERLLSRALSLAIALIVFTGAALAQAPSASPPYNIDLGGTGTAAVAPLIVNTARAPATVNSAQLNNLDKVGAICTFNQTASSGTPTVTFNIQNFDAASQLYYTVATSGSITPSTNTPQSIAVKPGIQQSSLPSSFVSGGAISLPLSRYWRVQEILAGSNTTSTGTLSCVAVK